MSDVRTTCRLPRLSTLDRPCDAWQKPVYPKTVEVVSECTRLHGVLLLLLLTSLLPARPTTAAQRPNIVVIMVDDLGFSDFGCYGGEIDTPQIDRLAADGLRFSQFYNAGRCCPTRASLLTGLYAHRVGLGYMTSQDHGKPGYRADLSSECVTIAEALRASDYQTFMTGKWHVCRDFAANGPRHNWPLQRGFDKYYGTLIAAGSLWNPPTLTKGNESAEPDGDYYYTEAITRHAVEFIQSAEREKPFFLYVAHPAPHWPLHARKEKIQKYGGRFAAGWDVLRERRLRRLIDLGLVDRSTRLSLRDSKCVPWDSLDAARQAWEQTRMEAYAAMVDHVDDSVGEIVAALALRGELDNTLIILLSDNGGESLAHPDGEIGDTGQPWAVMRYVPLWTRDGRPVVAGDIPGVIPGPADTFAGYGPNWANLSNTPFRRFKAHLHEGGIATPLIVHWPEGVAESGAMRTQPAHVVDIMATCLDVAGAAYPGEDFARALPPLDGQSLAPLFAQKSAERVVQPRTLFWEHQGNRAIRSGEFKLVSEYPDDWELYDLSKDRSELTDLAAKNPDRVHSLARLYDQWAATANVLPWGELDISIVASKASALRRTDAELDQYFRALEETGRRRADAVRQSQSRQGEND